MKKKLIRLTESDLHRIVKESVKRVLKENEWDEDVEGMEVNKENVCSIIKNICDGICKFKITPYDEFLCVTLSTSYYKVFNECTDALKKAFGDNKVIGDAFMNSIYVNF